MTRRRYEVLKDGEWFRPYAGPGGFLDQCCDCGLVHRVDYRIVEGAVHFRAFRDERATAALRRKMKKEQGQ